MTDFKGRLGKSFDSYMTPDDGPEDMPTLTRTIEIMRDNKRLLTVSTVDGYWDFCSKDYNYLPIYGDSIIAMLFRDDEMVKRDRVEVTDELAFRYATDYRALMLTDRRHVHAADLWDAMYDDTTCPSVDDYRDYLESLNERPED